MSLIKKNPRNNIHRWRNEKEDKYEGCNLNDFASSELELLKEFVRSKNARRIFMTYVRIGRFIQSMANEKVIKDNFKKTKKIPNLNIGQFHLLHIMHEEMIFFMLPLLLGTSMSTFFV